MKRKLRNRYLARSVDMFISLSRLDVPAYAGNASYFIVLAVVPTVMLLLNIISYTSLGNGVLLDILEGLLPEALYPMVAGLLQSMFDSSSSTLVSVTAFTSLWASSRGVYSILVGLNRIYGVQEDRGYVYTRLLSLVYTFLFLVVLLSTLVLYVFHQAILSWLSDISNPAVLLLTKILSNRFLLLLLIQIALFTAMFMFMPNRHNRFLASIPGAVFAALGWQLFSYFFSIYVDSFAKLSTIYGSLTALAVFMLWLFTCVSIIFYGGALNKYLSDIGYAVSLRKKRRNGEKDGNTQEER